MKCTPEAFAKAGKLRTKFPWAVLNAAKVAVQLFNYRAEAEQYAKDHPGPLTAVDATGCVFCLEKA